MSPVNVDVVVLTALPIEFRAFEDLLSDVVEEPHDRGTLYAVGKLGDLRIALVEAGAGNVPAALEAERAISHFRPRALAFVGVGGGLKDVALGDVVVATKVYGYESGKDSREFLARPDVGQTSYRFEQRARAAARHPELVFNAVDGRTPKIFVSPIAAGEKVVAAVRSATRMFLRRCYGDALAVEMEGRGALAAARVNEGVLAVVVRGISDLLSKKAAADASGSQERAARNAAIVASSILRKVLLRAPSAGTSADLAGIGPRTPPLGATSEQLATLSLDHPTAEGTDGQDVAQLSWSPDSSTLALAGIGDATRPACVAFWSRATNRGLGTVQLARDDRSCGVRWDPTAEIAVVSTRNTFVCMSTRDMRVLFHDGIPCNYNNIAISHDKTRVAFGNPFGTVVLTDCTTGKRVRSAQFHCGAASLGVELTWSRQDRLLVWIDRRACELWDSDGNVIQSFREPAPSGCAAAAWAPDGSRLAMVQRDGGVLLCDGSTGWWMDSELGGVPFADPSREADAREQAIAVTNRHVILARDGQLTVWCTDGDRRRTTLELLTSAAYYSSPTMLSSEDGRRVLVLDGSTVASVLLDNPPAFEWRRQFGDSAFPRLLGWDAAGCAWVLLGGSQFAAICSAGTRIFECSTTIGDAALSPDGTSLAIAIGPVVLMHLSTLTCQVLTVRADPGHAIECTSVSLRAAGIQEKHEPAEERQTQ